MYSNLVRYVSNWRVCLYAVVAQHRTLIYEGPMTLRFKFPRPRLECQLLACGYQVVWADGSTNLISLSWTDWCTELSRSFCFQLFQVQLVSSVMQFSGSSDHINHLSSNFNSPLLLIEQKYRHWSQFYFKKLVPAWHPTPCLLPAAEKLPLSLTPSNEESKPSQRLTSSWIKVSLFSSDDFREETYQEG